MLKLLGVLMLSVFLLGNSQCSTADKYQVGNKEDCVVLTKAVTGSQIDWTSCFCVDQNIKDSDSFITVLQARVKLNMSNHPLAQAAQDYLNANKDAIISSHQYELPSQYCRGYSATNPQARAELQKWAEDNRLNRIKCESQIVSPGTPRPFGNDDFHP